jgi:NO-binding membrane sensor protein with MHYT domain
MLHVHHFSYGLLTPALAYLMSFIGSLLGLLCTARAHGHRSRTGWLCAAAVSIGGTGIWVMHFIAILGFSIAGATIRFNVAVTLLSAAAAIVVVGAGLFFVSRPGSGPAALLIGGTLTGLGVAAMHYTGMAAMRTDAVLHYRAGTVALSVLIAVVAATAALWFTLRVQNLAATIGAALIMGIAVCGMHYTGMAALSATPSADPTPPNGADALALLFPLILIVSLVTTVLLLAVATTENENDGDAHELDLADSDW